jgi:molybdopterin/thiamine biosynthesis adenylyltransferase
VANWPERFPGRLDYEVEDFRDRGLDFVLDRELLDRGGPVVMRGRIAWRKREIELEVVYPDTFPFLRPEVYATDLALGRHQNPLQGNLCVLDRSTRAWHVDETGAWLVAERVPYLLDLLEEGGEALARAEAPQGEPMSVFYGNFPPSAIFVPDEVLQIPRSVRSGGGRIAFGEREPPRSIIRGLVASVDGRVRKGKTRRLAQARPPLRARFRGTEIPFRWARLNELPIAKSYDELASAVHEAAPILRQPTWARVTDGEVSVSGIVFEEEVRQGEYEDGWLFLVALRNGDAYISRGQRLSEADLGARIPRLAPLRDKTVALTGCGALGAPIALELARAQLGRLRALEHDQVEVGNTVRWISGLTAVGCNKLDVLTALIGADYPYTAFEPFARQLGEANVGATRELELEMLARLLDGADVLVEATAEIGIQHLLSTLADERDIPQVYAWATEGAFGGAIARVVPGATGCWLCLQRALDEGTIPTPPREERGTTQPRGCATPTFTGANFDLLPVVAQATRVAVRLLTGDASGDDVMVLALVDGNDRPLAAPHWQTFPLPSRPDCPRCGGGKSV